MPCCEVHIDFQIFFPLECKLPRDITLHETGAGIKLKRALCFRLKNLEEHINER